MHPRTIGATSAFRPRSRVARVAACAIAVPLVLACLGMNCPFVGTSFLTEIFYADNCPASEVLLGTQVILRVDRFVSVKVSNGTASPPRQLDDGRFEITITPSGVGLVSVFFTEFDDYGTTVGKGECEFNVAVVNDSGGGAGGSDPCGAAPIVQPLNAEFNAVRQSTTFTVSAADPDGEDLTYDYDWSVPSCGTQSFLFDAADDGIPTNFTEMTWQHSHPPCDPTTDHASETTTVVVSDGCWKVTCTYQGAKSGHGQSCALPQRDAP